MDGSGGRGGSIADGDTVTLLGANLQQHKIRLSGIDAPEKRQPFGNRSRLHLGALVFGKQVTADCPKTDRYKRAVCRIDVDGVEANLAQVEAGMAWHYKEYAHESSGRRIGAAMRRRKTRANRRQPAIPQRSRNLPRSGALTI